MGCLETVSGLSRGDMRRLKFCRQASMFTDEPKQPAFLLHLIMQGCNEMLGHSVCAEQRQHERLENLHCHNVTTWAEQRQSEELPVKGLKSCRSATMFTTLAR